MKRFIWIGLVVVLALSVAGCARTKRIANDVDWVLLDGQPHIDN